MVNPGILLNWFIRFIFLYILFIILFILGATFVSGLLPEGVTSEPGLVSEINGLLIVTLANMFTIVAIILTSRWTGWKLIVSMSLAYFGAVTFMMQIETWYFLSSLTVGPDLLPRLFLMGIPTAFVFVPMAVLILGKGRPGLESASDSMTLPPVPQLIWKLAAIVMAYIVLYWGAGYFIAWQNPELRAFYGQPGDILPFFTHTANTLRSDPLLFPFQIIRALLWALCALPVIRGSRVNPWWTALLVGVLFSVPQNIGHILANPLLPIASIRLSHMIETASSTFIFGMIVVWLLHRKHDSINDLFGLAKN